MRHRASFSHTVLVVVLRVPALRIRGGRLRLAVPACGRHVFLEGDVVDSGLGRRELAHFLRSRRERISPQQVGLPVGQRRRTAGLRREEVAVLAGLSPTWYSYL